MTLKLIVFFFFIITGFHLLISFNAPLLYPYASRFAYQEVLDKTQYPAYIRSFGNFDGVHYLKIATKGYEEYTQAFFPLFPLLISQVENVTQSYLLAGLLISNISFLLALIILNEVLKLLQLKKSPIIWFFILYLLFPTSFFLNAVYSESLFLLFMVSGLYFLYREKYVLSAVSVYLSALTRFIGVFLVIPIFFQLLKRVATKDSWKNRLQNMWLQNKKLLLLYCFPLLGLATYSFYLWKTTADPLMFLSAQPHFGGLRSTSFILPIQVIYRYFKIFTTAQINYQYFIAVIEFTCLVSVSSILLWDLYRIYKKKAHLSYERLGLNLFSIVTIIIPTLTGTFLSIPRFTLTALSFFIFLAEIKSFKIKIIIAGIFMVLKVVLLTFFIQGHFVS